MTNEVDLRALTGQVENERRTYLPDLKINSDPDNGPTGHFYIKSGDEAAELFPTAVFRPYVAKLQYQKYDGKANKMVGKSVNVNSMRDEAIDTMGGTKCGKLTKKQQTGLDASKLAEQKDIKVVRKLFGTVSLLNDKGKAVVKDMPVLWRPSGSAFIMIDELIDAVTKKRHILPQFNWIMTAEKRKNGGVIYFVPNIKPDYENGLKVTDEVIAQLKAFNEHINDENAYVTYMWNKANGVTKAAVDIVKELSLDDDISDLGSAKAA